MEHYLPSVLAAKEVTPDVVEIIIVDDGSTDASMEFLAATFPSIRVYALGRNRGFGAACNTGVMAARGELILLLNTDVEVRPNAIAPLIGHFTNPRVFAVAPVVYFPDGQRIYQGRSLATFKQGRFTFLPDEVGRTDLVTEACVSLFASGGMGMFRRDMFLRLGGFDPLYHPFYYEDTDIGYRAWKRGWITLLEPGSIMLHQHQATTSKQSTNAQIRRLEERNTLLFTWKNISDPWLLVQHVAYLPYHLLGSAVGGRVFVHAFGSALRRFPQALARRLTERPHQIKQITDRYLLHDILQQNAPIPSTE